MKNLSQLKVALVCDWLTDVGGAELVLLELHRMFPDAPIYTSQYNPKKIDWFKDADVRTGWLQSLPSFLKKLIPVLRAVYFSRLKLDGYDVIISSNTGAECKGIKTKPSQLHLCYMHAPTHYYWSRYDSYVQNPGWGRFNWLGRWGLKLLVGPMRRWDYRAAQRPDLIIANSTHTQAAIKKYYDRESVIVHPPVETSYFRTNARITRNGFIITGRQTPYKRFDLAVMACTQLGLPLQVVGDGPEHRRLKHLAGSSINFLGHIPRDEVRKRLQSAEAFIFPGEDDFGIAPVEAMAAGTPVIAYQAGGALDYVLPGQTGEFFDEQTVESLVQTLKNFKPERYQPENISAFAEKFCEKNFVTGLQTELNKILR